jgi:hypothetical protein
MANSETNCNSPWSGGAKQSGRAHGVSPLSHPRADSRGGRRADQTEEAGLKTPEAPVRESPHAQGATPNAVPPSMSAEEALLYGGRMSDLEKPERVADSVSSHMDRLMGRSRNFPKDD